MSIIVDQKPRRKAVFQLQRAAQAAVGRMVAPCASSERRSRRQHIAEHASPPARDAVLHRSAQMAVPNRAGIRPTAKAAAPSTAIQTPPRDCAARQTASSSPSGSRYTSAAAPRTRAAAGFDPRARLQPETARAPSPVRSGRRLRSRRSGRSRLRALTRCTSRLTLPSGAKGSDRCTLPHRQDSVLPPSVSLSETCT